MRALPFSRPALGWGLAFYLPMSFVCLTLTLIVASCSSYSPDEVPTFTATAMATIDTKTYGVDARRRAIMSAELNARKKLITQVMDMRLNDGRFVQDVALMDPFMRAVIDDSIRGANVSDRTISEEGIVTVTMKVGLEPILKMLEEYPLQLAEGVPAGSSQTGASPTDADDSVSPTEAMPGQ